MNIKDFQMRGLILELLKTDDNRFLDIEVLRGRLALWGHTLERQGIKAELKYLEDKGYIKIENKFGGEIIYIHITGRGVDLVQGTGPEDPGIFIPRYRI